MKNLLVVFNESIPDEKFKEKNARLLEMAKKYNFDVTLKSNSEVYTFLNTNSVKSFSGNLNYDCCLFFDHDAYLAKNLEMLGMRVINNSRAFLLCENKANLYQEMIAHKISIPKTFILPALNVYKREGIEKFVNEAINELSLPIVIKKWYGESGEGVYLAKRKEDVFAVIDKFKGEGILLQEFIAESAGTDVRIVVIKGKVITALRRESADGNFRSNASLGGRLTPYIPTIVETKLAIEATNAMGCDFAVVDMLRGVTGSLVCEVNPTANLYNFYNTTKVDIYEHLIRLCAKK
ncbi:MAG: RimK family alpha-L-glutamate ligase [Clostridiales bacterium]|nr:RimK family alpha-L-glutamate ligase [Clostridiales bacterium]